MELIKINDDKETNNNNQNLIKKESIFHNFTCKIILIANFIINIYLLIVNKQNSQIIQENIDFKNKFDYKTTSFKNNFPYNDKEMIGLNYPEINFDNIKVSLSNFNIIRPLIDLINQLEVKLIYLEKEINITKLIAFYTSRKFFLKEKKISYDENNLKELHEIVNWIIIHRSNQLKGIASDKYLACKYVEIKLGKNLCEQRIAVYNTIEELNYKTLSQYGNIALKISNSCWKTVFIYKNDTLDIFKSKMDIFKRLFEADHGLLEAQFFHLYAKKRIIIEKQFIPFSDLYEFKFYIINNNIKFIFLEFYFGLNKRSSFYDNNFNFIFKDNKKNEDVNQTNLTSIFKQKLLNKLKNYALKLSEDFPNFIRVDLYLFHNKIYFSELTFASSNGMPMHRNKTFVKNAAINFTRTDDYYK